MKKFIKGVLLSIIITVIFVTTLLAAMLQQSYRLNPPTAAERAQHPVLIRLLYGGNE